MSDIAFLFTNPRHHLEMMVPVARELSRRGRSCHFVSLAELRGFATPRDLAFPVHRAMPMNVRGSAPVDVAIGTPSGERFWLRKLARDVVALALNPRLRQLVRSARAVVIPNDSAYPYRGFVESHRGRAPFVLLQEGIRFDFPNGDPYGTCGVRVLCAWGEGSAEVFRARGVPRDVLRVTGTPRLDQFDPAVHRTAGAKVLAELGLSAPPLVYLSNPIEQQGFGTAADRMTLFRLFLDEAGPTLAARGRAVVVKPHKNEDPAGYVQASSAAATAVHVLPDASLQAVLAVASAAVVLTSTVGIDALLFGVPLGALEIPGHGFGFEYVSRKAAVGLSPGRIASGVTTLLDGRGTEPDAVARFIQRHVHDRGLAARHVADAVEQILS